MNAEDAEETERTQRTATANHKFNGNCEAGSPVRQADTLVTGMDGTAGITFTDNSLLSVGPNSTLAIDRYAFDSTTHAGQFDASLKKGSLAVVSGKIVKQSPGAMRVHTPTSIMGVRGTEFAVKVSEGGN